MEELVLGMEYDIYDLSSNAGCWSLWRLLFKTLILIFNSAIVIFRNKQIHFVVFLLFSALLLVCFCINWITCLSNCWAVDLFICGLNWFFEWVCKVVVWAVTICSALAVLMCYLFLFLHFFFCRLEQLDFWNFLHLLAIFLSSLYRLFLPFYRLRNHCLFLISIAIGFIISSIVPILLLETFWSSSFFLYSLLLGIYLAWILFLLFLFLISIPLFISVDYLDCITFNRNWHTSSLTCWSIGLPRSFFFFLVFKCSNHIVWIGMHELTLLTRLQGLYARMSFPRQLYWGWKISLRRGWTVEGNGEFLCNI